MSVALKDITVLDLTQGVSGPFATRLLSQMGARVIKVERPGGGDIIRFWDDIVQGMCSGHAWVNPGKESLALDLNTVRGREILMDLVKRVDVMIENFVPGSLEKWGLDAKVLRAANPRLIFCRVSGFGQDGPYRNRAALDLIVQGEAGLILTNGTPEEPAKISLSVCDLAGSMYSTIAIMEALYHRERTGEGQEIQVALLDSILTWTGYFPYMYWYRDQLPQRVGVHHHTMAPYGPYPTQDERMVIVAAGAGSRPAWEKFCNAIERPELVDDPQYVSNTLRLANRAALDMIVTAAIRLHDRAYWLERFHQFGIPAGAMNDLGEALAHPRVQSRGFIKQVDSTAGKINVFDFPPQFSDIESVNKLGPPALGEHTRSILAELGLGQAEIAALEASHVVESYARS